METRAHYVLVGAITLVILALGIVFSIWLARANFNAEYSTYDVILDGPVRGLQKGGEVRYNGIKVGEITLLETYRKDEAKVLARIRVDDTTPVRTSSEARLEAVGLTGVNLIQLTAGDPKDARLVGKRRPYPEIYAKKGALDDLVAAGKDIAQQAREAMASVQAVLTEENIASLTRTIRNLEAATANLSAKEGALARSAEAASSLRAAADSVAKLAETTNAKLNPVLDEAHRAAVAVADAAENARGISNSATVAADAAAYQAIPDVSSAARDLRRVALSLDRLAGQVETGQTSLVGGGPQKPTIKVRP